MDQAKIGRFLSELRKEKKITQEQLAEMRVFPSFARFGEKLPFSIEQSQHSSI